MFCIDDAAGCAGGGTRDNILCIKKSMENIKTIIYTEHNIYIYIYLYHHKHDTQQRVLGQPTMRYPLQIHSEEDQDLKKKIKKQK
jgi:hypothetical protein